MRLVGLDVEGLRGFGRGPSGRGRLHLAPITLVYGENSSGKSTLVRSLALLSQLQLLNRGRSAPVDWAAHGPWFGLGRPWDALHEGEDWMRLSWAFSTELDQETFRWEEALDWTLQWRGREALSLDGVEVGWRSAAGKVSQRFVRDGRRLRSGGPLQLKGRPELLTRSTFSDILSAHAAREDLLTLARGLGVQAEIDVPEAGWRHLMAGLWSLDARFRRAELDDEVQGRESLAALLGGYEDEDAAEQRRLLDRVGAAISLARVLDAATDEGREWSRARILEETILCETTLLCLRQLPFLPAEAADHTRAFRRQANSQEVMRELRNQLAHSPAANSPVTLSPMVHRFDRAHGELDEMVGASHRALSSFTESVVYIAAHRLVPARSYPAHPERGEAVGSDVIRRLASDAETAAKVSDALDRMFGMRLQVAPLYSHTGGLHQPTGLIELRVLERDGSSHSIADVGLGIAQVIPMLVSTTAGRCAIVEEPEANLHPTAQARLIAELVASADIGTPGAHTGGPRLVLETHSEHILQRVLQLIEKGDLKDEDVAINYVSRDGGRSSCRRVKTRGGRPLDPLIPSDRDSAARNPTLSRI